MSSSTALWSSPPQHSRIRLVKDRQDIETIYPLLVSYALALGSAFSFYDPDAPLAEPPKPVDAAAHALLKSRVRDLGLGETSTRVMLTALAWKKVHLLGQDPTSPEGFVKHNYRYAEAAAVLLLSLLETVEIVDLSMKNDDRIYYSLEILNYLHYFHRLPKFRNLILDGTADYQIEVAMSIGGLWSMDGGNPMVQLKTVGKCLLTQKETLRVLELDLENDMHANEPEEEALTEDYRLNEKIMARGSCALFLTNAARALVEQIIEIDNEPSLLLLSTFNRYT
ncbi:hypothetical protein LX32DRAFT_688203 [Colletotrichum zoysiae]|uniref:Uncharacterized protein n=1 Tax=Colletotrichum zoysiae TaxID=1216348 RepID=A0AAD9LW79_9PEZI|nr:hypothetical protein LX32DRAFT_688203 [Colletotrichum zoysiae]